MYSEIRKKPKNAVVIAAHSIILSWYNFDELNKFRLMMMRSGGVMGSLWGRERDGPWDLLMPFSNKYNCW